MADKKRFCDALLKVHGFQDRQARDLYLSELERQLGRSLVAPRHPDTFHDVWSLVTALQTDPYAMKAYVYVVGTFHGNSIVIVELERLLDDLYPGIFLRVEHRTVLERLVAELRLDDVANAFRDVFSFATEDGAPNWSDHRVALKQMDLRTHRESGRPAVLVFVDVLAHGADGPMALDLHRWIDGVGGSLGLSQHDLRGICLRTMHQSNNDLPLLTADGLPSPAGLQAGRELSIRLPEISGDLGRTGRMGPISTFDRPEGRGIWRGVPMRNPDFTGRQRLLHELHEVLSRRPTTSVLPEILYGLGGVGKTQIVVEYVHRIANHYDAVWWMSAELADSVRTSLVELGGVLGLPALDDPRQAASTVLNSLGTSHLRWLLVYDNADKPEDLTGLIPSAGGHVIVTTRNRVWATARIGHSVEVEDFERAESVELLRKRGEGIGPQDADRLADKLCDVPLALEQAATWLATTGMSVSEYLRVFDSSIQDLMSEGQPSSYPSTVYTSLQVAFDTLRERSPAAAELLDLFAFLGTEPLSTNLLGWGRLPDPGSELARALGEPISRGRAIRELPRYGLGKLDPGGIRVHPLVKLVLRQELRDDRRTRALANVQELLVSANPGGPDEPSNWPVYAEIGPHVEAALLVEAPSPAARQLVLDYARYLFRIGDYESSRHLSGRAFTLWSESPELGPDDVQTLGASERLANALRLLGDSERAQELAEDTFSRMLRHPDLGVDHEYTLQAADRVAVCLRVVGEFAKARELDEENLERHVRVYGETHQATLVTRNNLAVSLRMLGDFAEAYRIDSAVAERWQEAVGPDDVRTLLSLTNVARDLYGLGRYAEALETQQQVLPLFAQELGVKHVDVLWGYRTVAIALRKTGRFPEALQLAKDTYKACRSRLGPDHEHTLATTMSYGNSLRTMGEWEQATGLCEEGVQRYERRFGDRHPLTLVARVNLAIALRLNGQHGAAYRLSAQTLESMNDVLGPRHPYALCAAMTLANDLAWKGDRHQAFRLSAETYALSREVRGDAHPYTPACGINAAFDERAIGDTESARALFDESIAALRTALGAKHPEVIDANRGKRAECDIEPPPT